MNVFFDTSAIYAYINTKDPFHERIKNFVEIFDGKLIITNYIFDEIITLVNSRLGHKLAVLVGNTLLNSLQIENIWITQKNEKESWILFTERKDKNYSFTDCVSFVVMKELDIKEYLACDDDFRREGFKDVLQNFD